MAYECQTATGSYISTDMFCGGRLSYGPVGYVHEFGAADRKPLFTCSNNGKIYSSDQWACGSDDIVEFIGFAKYSK